MSRYATHLRSFNIKNPHLRFDFFQITCILKQSSFSSNNVSSTTKNWTNLSPSTSLQSSYASKSQFLYIMISLSRFSTPRWHRRKLVNTPIMEKIRSVSICEPEMPIICCAKEPMFGNLDSLATHRIKKSTKSTFSTWNLRNKNNSILKRLSIVSWVQATTLNNPHEIKVLLGGGSKLVVWPKFKKPITIFNMGIIIKSSYYCTNVVAWSLPM